MWISGKTVHDLPTFCVGAGNKKTEKVCLHIYLWYTVQESITTLEQNSGVYDDTIMINLIIAVFFTRSLFIPCNTFP